jgi:integrase
MRAPVNACEPAFRWRPVDRVPILGTNVIACCGFQCRRRHSHYSRIEGGQASARRFGGRRPTAICEVDSGLVAGGLIFTRTDGGQWRKSHQIRPMLDACRRAKINPAVSFHTLRHTHGSTLAMRGAPTAVIAEQLGHADTRMTEKHYAHLAPNYVADTIRACFPRLGIAGGDNVIPIGTQR